MSTSILAVIYNRILELKGTHYYLVADKAIICQEVRFLYVIALTGGGRRNHRLPPSPPSARQQHLQILERLEAADVIGYLVI